jgi:hypothetical protein
MHPHEGDLQVLAVMLQHGADLTKPTHTVHYLYFKSTKAAESAAEPLRVEGCAPIRVDVAPGQPCLRRLFRGTRCACIAETHTIPSRENFAAVRARMERLAAEYRGDYDGWEAAIAT